MYSWNLYYKWLWSAEEGKSDRDYSLNYRIYDKDNRNLEEKLFI